jgi:ADYC domain
MLAMLLVTGACVVDPGRGDEAVEGTAVSATARNPCTVQMCGENSPVIDALGFHELSLVGAANLEGYWILPKKAPAQIVLRGTSYDLKVSNNKITGWKSGVPVLVGSGLEGSVITVQHDTARYSLKIQKVRPLQLVAPPYDWIESYQLVWAKEHDDNFVNLCGGIPILIDEGLDVGGKVNPDLMNMTIWEAVVFEGDRLNTAAKTMSKTANDDWFTIGCATSAPAKLLLTRHTIHTQSAPTRAWEQRQAMFKMYTAAYCPGGESFTVARQKLVWRSKTVAYAFPPWKLEARWNESGATCLNNPRMLYPSTPSGSIEFPDIYAALAASNCHPPSCANLDIQNLDGADRMSSNPVP